MSRQVPTESDMKYEAAKKLKAATTPLESLRAQCMLRGAKGIHGLGRTFRIMDDDSNKKLSQYEFKKGISDYGVTLSDSQVEQLFKELDRDGGGSIEFEEFLQALRPPMSKSRKSLINKAFDKLDKTGDGVITYEDLKGVYNARTHPKYINGEWTERQCFEELLSTFEKDSKDKDSIITREEFTAYYEGISAYIDEDVYFDLMMRSAWKL